MSSETQPIHGIQNGATNGVNSALGLPGVAGRLAQLGAVGVLMWLVVYELPTFRSELREATQSNRSAAQQAHRDFLENERAAREHERERAARLYQAINGLTEELRKGRTQ